MSLIVTQISKHGIIHASDSNISDQFGKTIATGKKCFAIPKLKAGLTVAGSFRIGNLIIDEWMDNLISKSVANDLESFAEELRSSLEKEMTVEQKEMGCMIHIAGYETDGDKCHPEFWFVRNVYQINSSTGEYFDIKQEFIKTEDFWTRDNFKRDLLHEFQNNDGMYQLYINGYSPGRIGYNIVQDYLNNFFSNLWSSKNWKFRAPNNIDEAKLLIENYMRLINTIFILSDYPGQIIGGVVQMESIKQPDNIEI